MKIYHTIPVLFLAAGILSPSWAASVKGASVTKSAASSSATATATSTSKTSVKKTEVKTTSAVTTKAKTNTDTKSKTDFKKTSAGDNSLKNTDAVGKTSITLEDIKARFGRKFKGSAAVDKTSGIVKTLLDCDQTNEFFHEEKLCEGLSDTWVEAMADSSGHPFYHCCVSGYRDDIYTMTSNQYSSMQEDVDAFIKEFMEDFDFDCSDSEMSECSGRADSSMTAAMDRCYEDGEEDYLTGSDVKECCQEADCDAISGSGSITCSCSSDESATAKEKKSDFQSCLERKVDSALKEDGEIMCSQVGAQTYEYIYNWCKSDCGYDNY